MIDFICSAEGQTALAAYQEGTLRYTNAGYTVPENAWLTPSDEIVKFAEERFITNYGKMFLKRAFDV